MNNHNKPNILYLFTDQQSSAMMSCAGNPYLQTPAMDSIAANGIRFDRAYCTNPVCAPSRFSMMTGQMPGKFGIRSNFDAENATVPLKIRKKTIGYLLKENGYDTAYGGKVHLPPQMTPEDMGFKYLARDQRDELANSCVEFIQDKRNRPFMLIASFINPHDICYMGIRDFANQSMKTNLMKNKQIEIAHLDKALKKPSGISTDDFLNHIAPPVPNNFEPQNPEPEAIKSILDQRPFKRHTRENWSKETWQLHRWAYCKLTEIVDRQIQQVINALKQTNQFENTVIIFSSDHGDMDGSHQMEHKTALYEEATKIPLIISWKDIKYPGTVDKTHLVSNGLDLLPTICDFAQIKPPDELEGMSLKPIIENTNTYNWRKDLHVESEVGNMITNSKYKYVLYDKGTNREQLIDLQSDPGEINNLIEQPKLKQIKNTLRNSLFEKIKQYKN